MRKRILAGILTVMMLLSLLPTSVFAVSEDNTSVQGTGTRDDPWDISVNGDGSVTAYLTSNETTITGTYGDTIELPVPTAETYTFHIEGSGAMEDFNAISTGKKIELDNGIKWDIMSSDAPWANYCDSITQIDLDTRIVHIGNYAFAGCAIESLPWYGKEEAYTELTSIGEGAFSFCDKLTKVSFVSSIKSYGLYLFRGDTALTQIDWENYSPDTTELSNGLGITCICVPRGMFDGCIALTGTLSLPTNIEAINAEAFRGTGYTVLDFPSYMPGVRIINLQAFSFSSKPIEKFILPSVDTHPNTVLGQQAFRSCEFNCEVIVPYYEETSDIKNSAGIVVGGNTAQQLFTGSTMQNVILSNGIKTIASGTFNNVNGDSFTVAIPENLNSIGNSAFLGSSIKKIIIPANATIDQLFCYQCKNLNSVQIGNNVQIQNVNGIFANCPNWVAGIVEPNVTSIPNGMFSSLYNTQSGGVIYTASINQINLLTSQNYRPALTSIAVLDGGTFADNTKFEASKLADPTKEGYKFDGWYTSPDFLEETKVDDGNISKGTDGRYPVYYAKWTAVTADDQDTTTTAVDEVTEFPAEAPEITVSEETTPEETPEVAVPEEENGTEVSAEEPVNSVEDDTVTLKTALTFNDPGDGASTTYHFYVGENELGATSESVLKYNTTLKGLAIGDNTVEVYEGEKTEESTPVGIIKVTLKQKPLTVSGLTAIDRSTNGSNIVDVQGGSLKNVESGDTVDFTATGTMTDASAGSNKTVSVKVTLTGDDAEWYTVTTPTDVTVNITSNSGFNGSFPAAYPVTVDSAKNGTVKSDRTSASKGATVTITVTPDKDYELASLTVTDANGNRVPVKQTGENKFTFTMPDSKVTVSASFSKVVKTLPFTDVSANDYFFDAVVWAVENGVTYGNTATTFGVGVTCNRADAVTFIWRAYGCPAPKSSENPFTDVADSAYYADAVLWAVENGITVGTSATTFSPLESCRREHIVTFLYRAAGSPTVSHSSGFVDVADSAYYANAVTWAAENGITVGAGSATTFGPTQNCFREQIVTFLYRNLAE